MIGQGQGSGIAIEFASMQVDDIDQVLAIEQQVYPHPWSRTNFLDSLASGYQAWVLREAHLQPTVRHDIAQPEQAAPILGYVLVMMVVDEAHLLNVAVHADYQHAGFGRMLIDKAIALARGELMESVLLEVRPSNTRALAIYQRYGFVQIGRRKGYYPASNGTREDALVMRLVV